MLYKETFASPSVFLAMKYKAFCFLQAASQPPGPCC